jgi:hypothetical protein
LCIGSIAADRAHAVLRAERLGEAHHARARRRADADLLVLAPAFRISAELADARCGVQQKRAAQVHRRLDALVEDANLGAVADADDVPLDGHLVARAELEDLLRVGDRERDLMRCHRLVILPVVLMDDCVASTKRCKDAGSAGSGCDRRD